MYYHIYAYTLHINSSPILIGENDCLFELLKLKMLRYLTYVHIVLKLSSLQIDSPFWDKSNSIP